MIILSLGTVFGHALSEMKENRNMGQVQIEHGIVSNVLIMFIHNIVALDVTA